MHIGLPNIKDSCEIIPDEFFKKSEEMEKERKEKKKKMVNYNTYWEYVRNKNQLKYKLQEIKILREKIEKYEEEENLND